MVGNSTLKVGDIKYRDLNGDGKITEDDQCMISKYGSVPRLQYGFGGTINYKKIRLWYFLQWFGIAFHSDQWFGPLP